MKRHRKNPTLAVQFMGLTQRKVCEEAASPYVRPAASEAIPANMHVPNCFFFFFPFSFFCFGYRRRTQVCLQLLPSRGSQRRC